VQPGSAKALLGRDDVNDALPRVVEVEETDAGGGGSLAHRGDEDVRAGAARPLEAPRQGLDGVIDDPVHQRRVRGPAAGLREPGQQRRPHALVQEDAVDVQQRLPAAEVRDLVHVPDLLDDGAWRHDCRRMRLSSSPERAPAPFSTMCLIAIAWQAHPGFPLVVAANRDEWRDRPGPCPWWDDHPQILAGRDLQAGGTWMGVTRGGRFAAVTNFRDPSERRSTALSRGTLVTQFLLGTETPERFLADLAGRGRSTAASTCSWATADACSISAAERRGASGRAGRARALEPSPRRAVAKVSKARRAMRRPRAMATSRSSRCYRRHRRARRRASRHRVGIERERMLSPALITGVAYGTRTSTVLRAGPTPRASRSARATRPAR